MEGPDTFVQLPLAIDPDSKAVSSTSSSGALKAELAALNALHRSFMIDLEGPLGIPPPPVPVNPKRSAQVTKLKESGNASFKKAAYADAVRMYGLAIDMAAKRPLWEPAGLVREELSQLYGNRAQAFMAQQMWPDAALDAFCSTELKKVGNAKGWWRRTVALKEQGRLDEALDIVKEAIDFESAGPDKKGAEELAGLLKDVEAAVEKKSLA
jgi:translocation protein SEC72